MKDIFNRNPRGVPLDVAARHAGLGRARPDMMVREEDDAGPPLSRALVVYPPTVVPPEEARHIVVEAFDTLAAGGGSAIEPTPFGFNVPDGEYAVLKKLDLHLADVTAATRVTFMLLVNGSSPPGFGSLKPFPRVTALATLTYDLALRLPPGRVGVRVTNDDGAAAHLVGVSMLGWSYPLETRRLLDNARP